MIANIDTGNWGSITSADVGGICLGKEIDYKISNIDDKIDNLKSELMEVILSKECCLRSELYDELSKKQDLKVFSEEEKKEEEKVMLKEEVKTKFKVGDIVRVKKVGKSGSKFIDWNEKGEMDKFNGVIATVKSVEVKDIGLFSKNIVELYTLTGVKDIEDWDFAEDNLESVSKKLRSKIRAMELYGIKDILYKPEQRAVIVKFTDDTKEVSVCQDGDEFDPEKGLMICLLKKIMGNKFLNLTYREDQENILKDLEKTFDGVMEEL